MFCSKCGKTIDDNAAFCSFCGNVISGAAPSAPVEVPPQQQVPQQQVPQQAPQYSAPQQQAPQYSAPQQQAPQYSAPQQPAPQYGTPQQQTPQQGQYGYAQQAPTLTPAMINIINMVLKGALAILAILILIGAIGSLASIGSLKSSVENEGFFGFSKIYQKAQNMGNFVNLAKVPAIIAFSFATVDLVFMLLTKRKSKLTYANFGIGVILFTFNFVLSGNFTPAIDAIINESAYNAPEGGFITAGIFLLIGAVALLGSTIISLLKKEDLLFRPRPQYPPMPPMPPMPPAPPSYPPYQQ